MKNILDYRVVILDISGNIEFYFPQFGMHQDCLNDFAGKHGCEYSGAVYLTLQGNVILENAGSNILAGYLPSNLSDEQLYQLDYIQNWLGQVQMLEAYKFLDNSGKEKIWYQCIENVSDYFSNEIIQSYYSEHSLKK